MSEAAESKNITPIFEKYGFSTTPCTNETYSSLECHTEYLKNVEHAKVLQKEEEITNDLIKKIAIAIVIVFAVLIIIGVIKILKFFINI